MPKFPKGPNLTTEQIVARRKEALAAAITSAREPEAPQSAWNQFAGGVEFGGTVTLISSKPGVLAVKHIYGPNIDGNPDDTKTVADQAEWDKFARMPGEAADYKTRDLEIIGLGSRSEILVKKSDVTAPDAIIIPFRKREN